MTRLRYTELQFCLLLCMGVKLCLSHTYWPPNLRQRATPFIVGWFTDCTWEDNSKCCICLHYCQIVVVPTQ